MTKIHEIEQKCSVCGHTSPQPMLASTNTMGYPDLDLRPAEMKRSTMNTWILECPHCSYAARDLGEELEVSKDLLKSESYLTCDGYDFKGNLSPRFYRRHLIAKESNNIEECFYNLLYCAWTCDDNEDENAAEIRKQAIPYIEEIIPHGNANNLIAIKADLLRRTGQYEQLIEEYSNIYTDDAAINRVLKFQIQKAQEQDNACYTVEDVVESRRF